MKTHRTVLLVEDEPIIAMAEKAVLSRNGYQVVCAVDGEKAVELSATQPEIDLVLMDIDLGEGISGTEAAQLILNSRELPLIFLSSHTEPQVVEKTEGITSYGYIVKNSGDTVLLASIRMAFRLFEERQAVRQHELLLNGVFNSIQDGMSVLDADLTIRHVNHAMERWYPENEGLIGRKCHQVYHHREEVCEFCPSVRALISGEVEHAVVPGRADSSAQWLELYAYPMKDRVTGKSIGVVEFVRDITDKRRLEEELSETETRFRSIMSAMQDIVFTLNSDLRLTGLYGSGAQAYGLTPEHCLGNFLSEALGGDAPQVHEDAARNALTGTFTIYDWSARLGTGARSHFQTSLSPIHNGLGTVTGLVGITRDFTVPKRNEE
ncbi:MAG: PAS domain S-box protein [Spirochaetaceae bacterium]|nr:MAG: PAS domain S-box protein [Spirochaetaceae bacterium]